MLRTSDQALDGDARIGPLEPAPAPTDIFPARQGAHSNNLQEWLVSPQRLWFWSACFALLGIVALPVDISLANWFADGRLNDIVPGDLFRLLILSEVFALGTSVIIILAIVVVLDPPQWQRLPRIVCMSLGAGLIANLMKLCIVARLRPERASEISNVSATFVEWFPMANLGRHLQSCPSAHAATATGLFVALSACYPRGTVLFGAIAALACCQRVECGAHFLSDSLWGVGVGLAVAGLAASKLWPRRLDLIRP